MTDIVQGTSGFHLVAPAEVLDAGVELAAASWAAPHIRPQPDLGWVVARYVEADKANSNGHIFPLDQLRASYQNVVPKPLNMLHRRHHVIGAFTAAQLMEPDVPSAAAVLNPHVETLAAIWRYAFPDEYAATVDAFRAGSAFVSMEAVPKTMTCMACQGEFAYQGAAHDSYCEHLLASPRAPRVLNQAHFVGGAIIIPPTRPGWGQADIRNIAGLIENHPDEAEGLYDAIAAEAPHLDAQLWEQLMGVVLAGVYLPASEEFRLREARVSSSPPTSIDAEEDHDDHAMVCFCPSPEVAAALPGAVDVDEMHVTLGFLGTIVDDRVSVEGGGGAVPQERVLAAVAAFAAVTAPLPEAKISGVGRFDLDEGSVIYASVDAPGLPALRENLVGALAGAGVAVSEEHGFSPHVSLLFSDSDDELVLPELAEDLAFPVTHLEVWWGGDKHRFELAGASLAAHA